MRGFATTGLTKIRLYLFLLELTLINYDLLSLIIFVVIYCLKVVRRWRHTYLCMIFVVINVSDLFTDELTLFILFAFDPDRFSPAVPCYTDS